jgi:hypothetical protein
MFIFNKKNNSWYSWIGKFEDERVLVRLTADTDHPIAWEKIGCCRISISAGPIEDHKSEGPFTHLPNEVLDQMKNHFGSELTKFLCELQMRSLHFEELDRNPASRIDGIKLQDLTVRKPVMLPIANPRNALAQEYISLGFSEEE